MATSVTEAVTPLGPVDVEITQLSDLKAICADPVLAQRVARELLGFAAQTFEGRAWTLEDLRDVLDAACSGPARAREERVLQGRHFRKRLREQCALADRYGDAFGCVVMQFDCALTDLLMAKLQDAIVGQLRGSDTVFMYRRRVAIVLPRCSRAALDSLNERLRGCVVTEIGENALAAAPTLLYPGDGARATQAVLDWAEDQLR